MIPINFLRMRVSLVVLLGLLLVSVPQTFASEIESGGYLTVNSVDISLKPGYADVHVTYSLEDAFRFLVLVLGENDMRSRLLAQLNFSNASVLMMNYTDADIRIYDIQTVYGDGLYWFPAHEFNINIPDVVIRTNQSCEEYENISRLENGIVYF